MYVLAVFIKLIYDKEAIKKKRFIIHMSFAGVYNPLINYIQITGKLR